MTVTGVGWFLFGQILFVGVFVGIGGEVIFVSSDPVENPLH